MEVFDHLLPQFVAIKERFSAVGESWTPVDPSTQELSEMPDSSQSDPASATAFWKQPIGKTALAASAILAAGLIVGGYLLGDGLTRAREADRSVTVRGLAEKDVVADLATWTIAYSASANDMAT